MPLHICRDCKQPADTAICEPCKTTRYGEQHRTERAQWRHDIDHAPPHEPVCCWRCGQPIQILDPFDLGHVTGLDNTRHPEHRACNRGATASGR